MKVGYFLSVLLFYTLFLPGYANAAQSVLELKILPLECTFETVNDGSNIINYLTPEACRQLNGTSISGQPVLQIPGHSQVTSPILRFSRQDNRNGFPGSMYLNSYNEYRNALGKPLSLLLGQIVYFDIGVKESFERHSITLKEIGHNYIIVTIASTPFDSKIHSSEVKQYDVTNDGMSDIEVTLNGIEGDTANLTFRQLTEEIAGDSAVMQNHGGEDKNWTYSLVAVLIVCTGALLFLQKVIKV